MYLNNLEVLLLQSKTIKWLQNSGVSKISQSGDGGGGRGGVQA